LSADVATLARAVRLDSTTGMNPNRPFAAAGSDPHLVPPILAADTADLVVRQPFTFREFFRNCSDASASLAMNRFPRQFHERYPGMFRVAEITSVPSRNHPPHVTHLSRYAVQPAIDCHRQTTEAPQAPRLAAHHPFRRRARTGADGDGIRTGCGAGAAGSRPAGQVTVAGDFVRAQCSACSNRTG
jgi:hypothetical protein